ncbi:phosphotransferase [Myceligenerans indicum]|uniref:Phosphotransferase n=1 Tax=Myceligenerans indicum TaxID=2593663 RepID=A0ABS1LL09_9MICO|nr:phosphotransferase [Myceligenerans indicum]MBL0886904.1 phosphotransferase [Myceligenerans indicum]
MTRHTATITTVAPDTSTRSRMLNAFEHATERLDGRAASGAELIWGWRGRTLSGPVIVGGARVWLRLASGRSGEIAQTFWRGNATAQRDLPAAVPRPRLLVRDEWEAEPWRYAVEVFECSDRDPLNTRPVPSRPLAIGSLKDSWWSALRTALDDVATVPTDRFTVGPVWADKLVAEYFGPSDGPHPWMTCHGDLHWANLAGPDLVVFDWEGWGSGPLGYDAATLLVHSLLAPDLAAEVRSRFADVLDGEHGRYAQQVVVAEQLWRRRDTPHDLLLPVLRDHAAMLCA